MDTPVGAGDLHYITALVISLAMPWHWWEAPQNLLQSVISIGYFFLKDDILDKVRVNVSL